MARLLCGRAWGLSGGPGLLCGGPGFLSGSPGLLCGGPRFLRGGPVLLCGGPVLLRGSPVMFLGGGFGFPCGGFVPSASKVLVRFLLCFLLLGPAKRRIHRFYNRWASKRCIRYDDLFDALAILALNCVTFALFRLATNQQSVDNVNRLSMGNFFLSSGMSDP